MMFFQGLKFVPRLLCTLKPKKTIFFKDLLQNPRTYLAQLFERLNV